MKLADEMQQENTVNQVAADRFKSKRKTIKVEARKGP